MRTSENKTVNKQIKNQKNDENTMNMTFIYISIFFLLLLLLIREGSHWCFVIKKMIMMRICAKDKDRINIIYIAMQTIVKKKNQSKLITLLFPF